MTFVVDFSHTDDKEKTHLVNELGTEAGFKVDSHEGHKVTFIPADKPKEDEFKKLCAAHNVPYEASEEDEEDVNMDDVVDPKESIQNRVNLLLGRPVSLNEEFPPKPDEGASHKDHMDYHLKMMRHYQDSTQKSGGMSKSGLDAKRKIDKHQKMYNKHRSQHLKSK